MVAGELLVKLGILGGKEAVKSVEGVKTGMKELKSMAIETKVAIVAVIYELIHLTTQAAQMGSSITNTSALTGVATKTLQQYANAADQVGVSGQAVAQSFVGIQDAFSSINLFKGAPEWLLSVNNALSKMGKDGINANNFKDIEYVAQKIKDIVTAPTDLIPLDVQNAWAKSLGASPEFIMAARKGALEIQNIRKQTFLSDKELAGMQKAGSQIKKMELDVQQSLGKMLGKDNGKMIADIGSMAHAFMSLVSAIHSLAGAIGLLKGIGEGFKLVAEGYQAMADAIGGNPDKNIITQIQGILKGGKELEENRKYMEERKRRHEGTTPSRTPQSAPPAGAKNDIELNLNFQHPGENSTEVASDVTRALNMAYRQMSAQGQVS